MTTPRISTVIPAYQAERYLGEAIESVLKQSGRHEVIVVDDGSTDRTASVARRYPEVTVLSDMHRGIAAALNRGVEAAGGEYLAFLDADDLWSPSKIERQLAEFSATPALDMVFGHMRQFVSPDMEAALAGQIVCPEESTPGYVSGTLLVRRASFEQVGGFRDDWRIGQFVDWCARARQAGLRDAMLPDVVLHRRLHGGNVGLREPAARIDFVRIAKANLDRRRARQ